jgi:hypothetical protein
MYILPQFKKIGYIGKYVKMLRINIFVQRGYEWSVLLSLVSNIVPLVNEIFCFVCCLF